jgi:hypothetical protein
MLTLELFDVDDERRLFISPAIHEWAPLQAFGIDTVIDLEGGLDHCIPSVPGQCLYVYFPILDEQLPPIPKLRGIAKLGRDVVSRLRERRPGALFNPTFADYLESL